MRPTQDPVRSIWLLLVSGLTFASGLIDDRKSGVRAEVARRRIGQLASLLNRVRF